MTRRRGSERTPLGDALLRLVSRSDSFEDALSAALRLVCETADWPYGEIWYPDETGSTLRLRSTWLSDPSFELFAAASEDRTFERGAGLPGRVWRDGDAEWIRDLSSATTETFERANLATKHGLGAAVGVPVVADGETVAVLLFVTDERRDADEAFVDVVTDAGHQLGALFTSARVRDRLERERNGVDAVIENSPVPMVVVDAGGVVSRVNRRFETLLGVPREDVVGRTLDDATWGLFDDDGDPLAPGEDPCSVALREGRPVEGVSMAVEPPDGERRSFVVNATPIFGDDERPERVVTALVDVTDQRAREAELKRKNAELEAFASIVAHDLRNPLAVADGFTELARETGDPEHFDRVTRAHERMSTLISDLLLLARKGRAIGERTEVDVATVARSAWGSIDSGGATCTVDPETGTVLADAGRLRQLLENLLRNSVEHGSTGSRTKSGDSVAVSVGPLPDGAGFFVADDGPGVPADRRETLLSDAADGGLGLKIVAAIAEGHGWTLDLRDADPEASSPGLRVEVRLDDAAADRANDS